MNDKAGTMSAGRAWVFPLLAVLVSLGVTFLALKVELPNKLLYGVNFALFAGAAWAGVFLTKAGKGTGIGASVVGALLLAIGSYIVASMVVAAAAAKGVDLKDAAGNTNGHLALQQGASNLVGAIGGVIVAVVNFFDALVAGIIGAIVGGNMKQKAVGDAGAAQVARAA